MRGQRTPGQVIDLERPDRAASSRAAGCAAPTRDLSAPATHAAARGRASPRSARVARAGPRRGSARGRTRASARGNRGRFLRPGSARLPRAVISADDRRRFARVSSRRVLLGRIRHIHHVMRNPLLLLHRHLVGADVEAAIDRGRVAGDDFPTEQLRERDAERALARRGRPDASRDQCFTGSSTARGTRRARRGARAGSASRLAETASASYLSGDSLKKNVTVKNALSSGYSGGSASVGFDAAMALNAELVKASTEEGFRPADR